MADITPLVQRFLGLKQTILLFLARSQHTHNSRKVIVYAFSSESPVTFPTALIDCAAKALSFAGPLEMRPLET